MLRCKLAKIEEGEKGALSFLASKYNEYIYATDASIVIVNKTLSLKRICHLVLIRVENAYESFSKLLEVYNQIKIIKRD